MWRRFHPCADRARAAGDGRSAWRARGLRAVAGACAVIVSLLVSQGVAQAQTFSMGSLDRQLGAYLAGLRGQVGVVVYDVNRGRTYSYNGGSGFTMASSVKVPIMLTFFAHTEAQRREPNSYEMYLLRTMIENSNNNSAQALWDRVGGASGVAAYLRRVGVAGIRTNPRAWGYSTATPSAMVGVFGLLQFGRVLTARDRALALGLLRSIERDQRMGVGDTAPRGASVAMKDGWVIGPDGHWATNSTGIVTVGRRVYIISVYTQHDASLGQGWSIVRHVCAVVAARLG